jgi:hypothetical protein
MSRIVIVILIDNCHKPIDLIQELFFSLYFFPVFCLRQSSKISDVFGNFAFAIINKMLFLSFQEAEKQQLKDQVEQFKLRDKERTEKVQSQKEETDAREEERRRLVKEQEER